MRRTQPVPTPSPSIYRAFRKAGRKQYRQYKKANTDRKTTYVPRPSVCFVCPAPGYCLFSEKKSRSPSPSLSHRCQTHASSSSSTIVPTKYRPILQPLRPLSGSAPPRRRRTAKTPAYPSRCRFHKRHAPSAAFPSTYRRNACTSGIQHRAVIFAKSGILSYEIRHPLPQMPCSDYSK